MPAIYAHYRFGRQCLEMLPEKVKALAFKYRDLYNIGTHGPDILFYFEPYHSNPISAIGFGMHDIPAAKFFTQAQTVYQNCAANQDQMLAYLLGFVSHFVLDYSSHSYIEAKEYYDHVSHTEIESQNDRHLLIIDGYDPLSYDIVCHIRPNNENASLIQNFFPEISIKNVHKALSSMVFFMRLIRCPSDLKRNFMYQSMKVLGLYDSLHEQIISKQPNPLCKDSNRRLDEIAVGALTLYKQLANNLIAYLRGESELDERFNKTFGAQANWQAIKI